MAARWSPKRGGRTNGPYVAETWYENGGESLGEQVQSQSKSYALQWSSMSKVIVQESWGSLMIHNWVTSKVAMLWWSMGFWGSIGGCEPRLPDAACFTKPQEDIEMAKVRDHQKGFRTDRTLGWSEGTNMSKVQQEWWGNRFQSC